MAARRIPVPSMGAYATGGGGDDGGGGDERDGGSQSEHDSNADGLHLDTSRVIPFDLDQAKGRAQVRLLVDHAIMERAFKSQAAVGLQSALSLSHLTRSFVLEGDAINVRRNTQKLAEAQRLRELEVDAQIAAEDVDLEPEALEALGESWVRTAKALLERKSAVDLIKQSWPVERATMLAKLAEREDGYKQHASRTRKFPVEAKTVHLANRDKVRHMFAVASGFVERDILPLAQPSSEHTFEALEAHTARLEQMGQLAVDIAIDQAKHQADQLEKVILLRDEAERVEERDLLASSKVEMEALGTPSATPLTPQDDEEVEIPHLPSARYGDFLRDVGLINWTATACPDVNCLDQVRGDIEDKVEQQLEDERQQQQQQQQQQERHQQPGPIDQQSSEDDEEEKMMDADS